MIDQEPRKSVRSRRPECEHLSKDVASVNDAARGKFLSVLGVALALTPQLQSSEAQHLK